MPRTASRRVAGGPPLARGRSHVVWTSCDCLQFLMCCPLRPKGGAAAALGGIDILVANASALSFGLNREAFHSALDVDLIHTVTAVEAAMPHIEHSSSGSIVAIGSIGGIEDSELNSYAQVSYGAIKAALHFY